MDPYKLNDICKWRTAERYSFTDFGDRPCSAKNDTYLHNNCSVTGKGVELDTSQNDRNLLLAEELGALS